MDANEFRRFGHALVEWIAAYRERVEQRPVMSPARPGDVRKRFPDAPPLDGGHLDEAIAMLDAAVLPGITHWNHPSFFAYFPSNTSFGSILGDLVSSGLGAQGMSWQTSPAATELEEVVLGWLRQMVGLPADFVGVVQDTASTATFTALVCARERSTAYGATRGGLQDGGAPLVVYTSDQAHSSVLKDALLAGFGKDHVRVIGSDGQHAMRADLLREALAADVAAGLRPCAVVASVGTTGTTAVDPIGAIAEIAASHGAWLHVDAALAGSAMILEECRPLWAGVERADSVVLNPHKWLGVGFDFSAYYVRDPQHLVRVMSTNPSYLRTNVDSEVTNYRDWHPQLGRRFRALKLWFVLMDQGVDGLRARLRRDLAHARRFAALVDAAPDWERLAPVPFQTVCIRHRPAGMPEEALAAHNLALVERINTSGRAYLTPAVVKGVQLIRVSFGAEPTEDGHVDALWGLLLRSV
jgi:aromatic-L-amino-acid decarboxylase